MLSAEINTLTLDGARLERLTRNARPDLRPAFSPDGRQLAYNPMPHPERDRNEIIVMNADGSAPRRLAATEGETDTP
jgi:Tol biopolymer transport system component